MHRYLLNFSYIGTQFRGAQKNICKLNADKPDLSTIQGLLEVALLKFNNENLPSVSISSRTDTGVHALNSTGHVDLDQIHNCHKITLSMNSYFNQNGYSVRVLNTRLVPREFHCRFNAVSRTYVYRLAILKKEYSLNEYRTSILRNYINIPIEEINRCVFVYNPRFNLEAIRQAASLIEGKHDFRTFMAQTKKNSTLRYVKEIKIEKSSSICLPYTNSSESFDFWDITFKARSFLYRQVRRTVGVLLGVAQGVLSLDEVTVMLQVPSGNSWPSRIKSMPAHGLYLCNVEYRPEDLMLPLDYISSRTDNK